MTEKKDMGTVGFMEVEGEIDKSIKGETTSSSTSDTPIVLDFNSEAIKKKFNSPTQLEEEANKATEEKANTKQNNESELDNNDIDEELPTSIHDNKSFEELVELANETCTITSAERQIIIGYRIYDETVLDEIELMIKNSIESEDKGLLIGAIEFVTEIRDSIKGIEDASRDAVKLYKSMMRKKFDKAFDNYRLDNKKLMGAEFDEDDNRSHNFITYLMCVGMKRVSEESKRHSTNNDIMTTNIRNVRNILKDFHYTIDSRNNYYVGDDGKTKITNINALIGLTTMFDQFFSGTRDYDFDYIKDTISPTRLVDKSELDYPVITNFNRFSWLSDDTLTTLKEYNEHIDKMIYAGLQNHYSDIEHIHDFANFNNDVLKKYLTKLDKYTRNTNMNLNRKVKENKRFINTPKGVSMIADKLFSEGFVRSILKILVGNKFIQDVGEESILPFDKTGTPNPALNNLFKTSDSNKLHDDIMTMIYDLPTVFNSGIFFKELKYYLENYVKNELNDNVGSSELKVEEMDIAQFTMLQDIATMISLYISYDGESSDSVVAHMTRHFSSGRVLTDVPTEYFKFYKPKEANEDVLKYWMIFRLQQTKQYIRLLSDDPKRYNNLMSDSSTIRQKKQMKKLKNQK